MRVRRALLWAGLPALLTAVADQWTKAWAIRALRAPRRCIEVSEAWWKFCYSENTGSAFGLFQGGGDILTVIGIGALAFVSYLLWKHPGARGRSLLALGLIAGGAIGNLGDRLFRGYVVDFVVWHAGGRFTWPAFNVADAALVAGVAAILIWPEKEKTPEATAAKRA